MPSELPSGDFLLRLKDDAQTNMEHRGGYATPFEMFFLDHAAPVAALLEEREQQSSVYRERAHLVAALAKLFPSCAKPDSENDGWAIVYITLPTGQVSWHIAPDDLELFTHTLARTTHIEWDGHDTEEKYRRLDALQPPSQDGGWKCGEEFIGLIDSGRVITQGELALRAHDIAHDLWRGRTRVEKLERVVDLWASAFAKLSDTSSGAMTPDEYESFMAALRATTALAGQGGGE